MYRTIEIQILKKTLTVAGLLLGLATASPAAAVQCGDTIGPNQTVVLQQDVGPCDDTTGGLTVIGPAELNLNGFLVYCEASKLSPPDVIVPDAISIEGQSARVHNGSILFCHHGVRVAGQGQHTVDTLAIQNSAGSGLLVESNRNSLRNISVSLSGAEGVAVNGNNNKVSESYVESADGSGFGIYGNKNQLRDNTATQTYSTGFYIAGDHNRLEKNQAVDNYDGFSIETELPQDSASRNTLVDNEAHDNSNWGFIVYGSTEKTILLKNSAQRNGGGGFSINGRRHKLKDNEAILNGLDGIKLRSTAQNITIKKSVARDNSQIPFFDTFDLDDNSSNCGTNTWAKNIFGSSAAGSPPVLNPLCIQ